MVGAQLEGFDCMVKLSESSKIAIIEGDEYLSSPIDRRPKFHLYRPNIAVISGIAWDHINVFPTFENYIKQFHIFAESIHDKGALIFCEEDENLNDMVNSNTYLCQLIPYSTHNHIIEQSNTLLIDDKNNRHPIEIFGIHNLQNLKAAQLVCEKIGIDKIDFYQSVSDFKGASKRMELVKANDHSAFYKDFAHSPSKLKATTNALKNQFPERKLVACMELHTFSSLNAEFLKLYSQSMLAADIAYVYYNLETIKHKRLENITEQDVYNAFETPNVKVFTSSDDLQNQLFSENWDNSNLLMMSSGNFDGLDFDSIANKII
jgi:UDP-N-acetylmuramate: L-alanyl-gamma-D-glutamyl-meso-diaminopimelate ligase